MENNISKIADYLLSRYEPKDVNRRHKEKLHFQDRIALSLTRLVGTMYAVYFFAICFAGWMLWQSYFDTKPFDPYPFAFMLFISNIIGLLLMPLIMVGQNIQGRHSEIRAEEEFQTTSSSYEDLEQILLHLDKQDKQMQKQLDILVEMAKKK